MVELISHAPEYEGALIEVTGFYGGGALTALFLTREHAEINDWDSAFLVADATDGFITEHCKGHYVRIAGRFMRRPGVGPSPDPENFGIRDVTKLSILGANGKETVCWPSKGRK
jgi:hypothetical protein